MSDHLSTYLHDHLAGARFAIELLESLQDAAHGEDFRVFAVSLLAEIQKDREVLEALADRVGEGHVDVKEVVAWLGEKASQLKLRGDVAGFGTFEALETLGLGILGKFALWRVLPLIASFDSRLLGPDFEGLAARALEQHKNVEKQRLLIAQTAFAVPARG